MRLLRSPRELAGPPAFAVPPHRRVLLVDDALLFPGLEPTKRCTMCGALLPLDQFHRNRTKRDGLQNRCRACNIALNKKWYRDNPDARPRRMDGYARRRREERQREVWEYLRSHACVDCGEPDPVVLEFDHLRDKVDNISKMASLKKPWAAILAEIAKCEVVCANCHRRRTAHRINSLRYRWGNEAT